MSPWLLRCAFLGLLSLLFPEAIGLGVSATSAPDPASLLEVFDTVLQRVVIIRQLEPKGPIQRGIRSRQQIRVSLRNHLDDELSPEEWTVTGKAMHQWGLLPIDFPLKAFVLDLLTEQAAGYYDPKRQQFFIADWLPPDLQRPIMAHELVHALQDQHYGLQGHFAPVEAHSDLSLARKALVEGDAMAVMLEYMLRPLGLSIHQIPSIETLMASSTSLFSEPFNVFERAPLVLKQQLLFPYLYGLGFIKAALAHADWSVLRQVYQKPPSSTEQILHPEKYFSDVPDRPYEVSLQLPERLFRESWHRLKSDVLGEFLLSVILRQFLTEAEAKRSAAGWRGDRYELFEHKTSGRLFLVCLTMWDTPRDADEFFRSYVKLLALKYPNWTRRPGATATEYLWQRGQFRLLLGRRGQAVHIIEGVPAADLPQLRRHLYHVTHTETPPSDRQPESRD